ncbi:MAG: copper resistance protein B [Candidatus Thiodiazotropha sp.]|nr:copper resistance protein B [Candidatus Thiodiazotropha sp.]MCM8883047.1 copper resistance protein B [Candidatus Thiodiazotropha sp.]MCM8918859.1 copper resistance protein B [Candidatus Thiodiazotropha sp.]
MKKTVFALMAMGLSTTVFAGGADDPLVYKVMVDKLEIRNTGGNDPFVLDADAWVGYDLNKFWFKTEVERVDGETEEAEVQFLYSRAVAPFWDVQAGWRRDIKPEPDRDFLALGFKGLAPYMFEVDAGVFIGESGQVGARLDAEYEYMLTQKLILSPEIEMNLYSKDDEEVGIGSGLSDMELGLRLRYEVLREFAPYIGVNWTKIFGQTADFASDEGEDTSDLQMVIGIRAWF